MFADLKEKAAGLDRKRVYTAVAALVIAGAAGHFMQRTASAPDNRSPVVASVAGTLEVPAPVPAPKPAAPAPAERVARDDAPAAVEPAQTPVDKVAAVTEPMADEPAAVIQEATLADAAEPVEQAAPDAIAPDVEVAAIGEADPADMESAPADADVTRGASSAILGLPDETLAPATEPLLAPELAADPAPSDPAPTEITIAAAEEFDDLASEPTAPEPNCTIGLDAVAQNAAMVAISLTAPCNSGEDVSFEQAGLEFSEQLGPDGDLFLLAPAMSEDAIFVVTFSDGQEKAVEVQVDDFADYERVALVWKGATGLQLNALENGANYGDDGHIWAEHPGTPDIAAAGEGGFVSVLGSASDGYAADVYTYPAGLMDAGNTPDVSVEAQVMENTCESIIEGRILRTNPGRAPTMQPLSIAVPGCDAVGEYLVLKNLPQDLKLARN